ncbi:hypothetical protein ACFL1A_00690 [Patescibacteria group bacterium]
MKTIAIPFPKKHSFRVRPVALILVLLLILVKVTASNSSNLNNRKNTRSVRQTQQAQNLIAMLDDDPDYTETAIELLSGYLIGYKIIPFLSCDQLLITVSPGKYKAYILDYELGRKIYGTMCIPRIKTIDPKAIIIGKSVDPDYRNKFLEKGADDFFYAADELKSLAYMILSLIR